MRSESLDKCFLGAARSVARMLGQDAPLLRPLRPLYEALLDRMGRERGVPFAINGVMYRIDRHHRYQLRADYESDVAAFLRERVRPGQLCIDVGANVGA